MRASDCYVHAIGSKGVAQVAGTLSWEMRSDTVANVPMDRIKGLTIRDSYGLLIGAIAFEARRCNVEIYEISVHKKYRRQGFGKRLISQLARMCVPERPLIAIVPETDAASQLFFQACGFWYIETYDRHFRDGSHGLKMRRRS